MQANMLNVDLYLPDSIDVISSSTLSVLDLITAAVLMADCY
jgi:hypothetical protein